jgi:hypothetical protein
VPVSASLTHEPTIGPRSQCHLAGDGDVDLIEVPFVAAAGGSPADADTWPPASARHRPLNLAVPPSLLNKRDHVWLGRAIMGPMSRPIQSGKKDRNTADNVLISNWKSIVIPRAVQPRLNGTLSERSNNGFCRDNVRRRDWLRRYFEMLDLARRYSATISDSPLLAIIDRSCG